MTLYQTTVGKPAAATVVLGLGLCSACTITEENGTEREATFQESMDQANEGLGAVTEAAESTADFVTAVSNIYCVITGKCPVRDTEGRYDEPAPPPPGPAPPRASLGPSPRPLPRTVLAAARPSPGAVSEARLRGR